MEKIDTPKMAETTLNLSITVITANMDMIHNATDMLSWNGINARIDKINILSALSAIPFPLRSTPMDSPLALV